LTKAEAPAMLQKTQEKAGESSRVPGCSLQFSVAQRDLSLQDDQVFQRFLTSRTPIQMPKYTANVPISVTAMAWRIHQNNGAHCCPTSGQKARETKATRKLGSAPPRPRAVVPRFDK
jgi:hypothetical protein